MHFLELPTEISSIALSFAAETRGMKRASRLRLVNSTSPSYPVLQHKTDSKIERFAAETLQVMFK